MLILITRNLVLPSDASIIQHYVVIDVGEELGSIFALTLWCLIEIKRLKILRVGQVTQILTPKSILLAGCLFLALNKHLMDIALARRD